MCKDQEKSQLRKGFQVMFDLETIILLVIVVAAAYIVKDAGAIGSYGLCLVQKRIMSY